MGIEDVTSIEDERRRIARYRLPDGKMLAVGIESLELHGLDRILRGAGYGHLLNARMPVVWCGRIIGTLPAAFDSRNIQSASFMYQPRAGDFTRDGDRWIASDTMGLGDLRYVVGFEESEPPKPRSQTPASEPQP